MNDSVPVPNTQPNNASSVPLLPRLLPMKGNVILSNSEIPLNAALPIDSTEFGTIIFLNRYLEIFIMLKLEVQVALDTS